MADPDRRPTAQEIEELIDLVRRDPSSPAFIDLSEAYLNLGRPKDAISVANVGLQASPDSLEGRVMLARAHAALHQWKEAQGELLRVVKVDRSNRLGFSLLGEVLLRRNDYERAVPVLQHAQNLDPTSPQVLSMLKRARAGQPLDPPAPIPTPVPPRGETNYALQLERAQPSPQPPPPARMPAGPMPQLPPQAPTMAIQPAPAAPPPQPPRAPRPTAPPPQQSIEGVRPRVISTAKPQNAASAALRQSAAVGENYLNDLLTGGLLDVAGVRVPDSDFDLRPDRRWGRSTRRAFIFLFVVLVLGIGGGGTWYWYSESQKAAAVAKLQKEAQQAIGNGEYAGLEASLGKLKEAIEKDKKNRLTLAYFAQTAALESLLYGTDASLAETAMKSAGKFDDGEDGARELVIARAATQLASLPIDKTRTGILSDVSKGLDEYLAKHGDDTWATWLKARALLAGGQRNDGRALLKKAGDGNLVLALIDQADLLAEDGKIEDARALYDKALATSKKHPLAVLGKALALAESYVDTNAVIEDLNTQLGDIKAPRVDAYKELAKALANNTIESFTASNNALTAAVAKPPADPRFWADVTWAYLIRGELTLAAKARGNIPPYAGTEPSVVLVGAGFLLASGLPQKALDAASKLDSNRAAMIRAYAELELGKAKEAATETEAILSKAPGNLEAQILHAQAEMIAGPDKVRATATEELEGLARRANSKLGRHALGMGYYAIGDLKNAQPQLEQALADVKEDSPNPLAYRTRTALADILFKNGDPDGAKKQLDKAFETNSGYFPALGLSAQLVVKADPDHAIELISTIANEADLSPQLKLVLAEAIATHKLDVNKKPCACPTEEEKGNAKKLLEEIKDQIQPPTEVGRVAALIDPKLPEELGVPTPDGTPGAPAVPDKSHGSRNRRGHR